MWWKDLATWKIMTGMRSVKAQLHKYEIGALQTLLAMRVEMGACVSALQLPTMPPTHGPPWMQSVCGGRPNLRRYKRTPHP